MFSHPHRLPPKPLFAEDGCHTQHMDGVSSHSERLVIINFSFNHKIIWQIQTHYSWQSWMEVFLLNFFLSNISELMLIHVRNKTIITAKKQGAAMFSWIGYSSNWGWNRIGPNASFLVHRISLTISIEYLRVRWAFTLSLLLTDNMVALVCFWWAVASFFRKL